MGVGPLVPARTIPGAKVKSKTATNPNALTLTFISNHHQVLTRESFPTIIRSIEADDYPVED